MRYIVGIDLGTTNSCVSYVDTTTQSQNCQLFKVPQLSGQGHVDRLATLPSYCYLDGGETLSKGALDLPWKKNNGYCVGAFALHHGSRIPTRLVSSAKSWLCHRSANQKEAILPFDACDENTRISPIEASRRYLNHIREAWNHEVAKGDPDKELEQQEVVLTVPASFDEVARALTAEAAKQAGYNNVAFLEEPQAAFYNWISHHQDSWEETFSDGDTILVCDVGGGTTDFSLIEFRKENEKGGFERKAVGDHLLLGGDNLDTALAYYLEEKIAGNGGTVDPSQWRLLYHQAQAAKEALLSGGSDVFRIVVQGQGSSVIKGGATVELSAKEAHDLLLNGFFPLLKWSEALDIRKTQGLRTMGLPYEDDPCITKQLAHFLNSSQSSGGMCPTHILFNGGTMMAGPFQQRVLESLEQWFPQQNIAVLHPKSMMLAVARGAAYYGKVRRGQGVRIRAGSPRSFYLGFDDNAGAPKAICLIARGAEEGTTFRPTNTFSAKANRPVSFTLYASHTRLGDTPGDIIDIDETQLHKMPPIFTVLRYGKQTATATDKTVKVQLEIEYTPLGTLQLWLASEDSDHRWALEFQLKSAGGQENQLSFVQQGRKDQTFNDRYLEEAKDFIKKLFTKGADLKAAKVMESIENAVEIPRQQWPPSVLRGLWEPLLVHQENKKLSQQHESRWWNMAGYFLRPGFGYPLDDHRLKDLWRIVLGDLQANKNKECTIQKWICYRRVAGGLNKGQQTQIFHHILPCIFNKKNGIIDKKGKSDSNQYNEILRTLASLERVDVKAKISLGRAIIKEIEERRAAGPELWALGRLGGRSLMYGSPANVIPSDECCQWVEKLLVYDDPTGSSFKNLAFTLCQLARKTQHKELNLPESARGKVRDLLNTREGADHLLKLLDGGEEFSVDDQDIIFGEHLPQGLSLTANDA